MTDDEHLAVEVAQYLQHVHDIADLSNTRRLRVSCGRLPMLNKKAGG